MGIGRRFNRGPQNKRVKQKNNFLTFQNNLVKYTDDFKSRPIHYTQGINLLFLCSYKHSQKH